MSADRHRTLWAAGTAALDSVRGVFRERVLDSAGHGIRSTVDTLVMAGRWCRGSG